MECHYRPRLKGTPHMEERWRRRRKSLVWRTRFMLFALFHIWYLSANVFFFISLYACPNVDKVTRIYHQLNLSRCSLTTILKNCDCPLGKRNIYWETEISYKVNPYIRQKKKKKTDIKITLVDDEFSRITIALFFLISNFQSWLIVKRIKGKFLNIFKL